MNLIRKELFSKVIHDMTIRRMLIAMVLGACLASSACGKSSSRQGTTAWMEVVVTGDVVVSLWRPDGTPLGYYETNDPPAKPNTQWFGIYTADPVIVRLVYNQSDHGTLDIVSWSLSSRPFSGGFMGGKAEELDQHAIFQIDGVTGTNVEVVVARDSDFNDLRLQIDRDANGTVDAEQIPTVTTEE